MVTWRQPRLERHGRCDPGAPRNSRRRRPCPSRGSGSAGLSESRRRLCVDEGHESDAQSTAWAIQALLSAGERPGKAPFRFLARLRRSDGSYRYSVRYGSTPVWVTAQVLPALAGRPFPLR